MCCVSEASQVTGEWLVLRVSSWSLAQLFVLPLSREVFGVSAFTRGFVSCAFVSSPLVHAPSGPLLDRSCLGMRSLTRCAAGCSGNFDIAFCE